MPSIYEARCSACHAVAEAGCSDGYWAVCVNEPASEHAHPEDPYLVILGHPCESMILAELGDTFSAAAWNGRLVSVAKVFCKNCGRRFEIRRISADLIAFGGGGCLGIVALAAAAAVGVGRWVGASWVGHFAGCATFGLLITAIDKSVDWFVRTRHREQTARFDTPAKCPHCGSLQYASPGLLRRPIPCTQCGQRAVRFRVIGKS